MLLSRELGMQQQYLMSKDDLMMTVMMIAKKHVT